MPKPYIAYDDEHGGQKGIRRWLGLYYHLNKRGRYGRVRGRHSREAACNEEDRALRLARYARNYALHCKLGLDFSIFDVRWDSIVGCCKFSGCTNLPRRLSKGWGMWCESHRKQLQRNGGDKTALRPIIKHRKRCKTRGTRMESAVGTSEGHADPSGGVPGTVRGDNPTVLPG